MTLAAGLKLGLAALTAVLVTMGGFLAWRVWEARQATPALLAGIDKGLAVRLGDLPEERVETLLAVEDPGFWRHDGIDMRTPGQGRTT